VAEPIQFYMDQHFPGQVTRALRRHGINVLTAQDAGRCGLPDANQLAFATAEERVMGTFDTDFLALHRSGIRHAGIAWCPEQKHGVGQLIRLYQLLHGVVDRDAMRNHVEYL
jgi:hypothetical protein